MLKNLFGKLIGNSKLVIASLMAIPMMTVLLIFILSHALFTPEQPSTDEIINSLTHKAKLGGIDLASLGIEIDLGDNETDNETQEQGYVVTEDGLIIWDKHYYYEIARTFVTNVKGQSDTIVRANIAVSSYLAGTVGENYSMQMTAFDPMMMSAVLNFMTDTTKSDYIGSKNIELTSKKIKDVINEVLKKQEARYFVDHVYFVQLAMNDGRL